MNFFLLIICIVFCELVGIVSGLFSVKPIKGWYRQLKKPSFNPPNAIFGPVWTILYGLMGVSFYLVLMSDEKTKTAITLFLVQLALNFFWSLIFFNLKKLQLAFIEILFLLFFILLTLIAFWQINSLAGLLLVPYFLWSSFATLLTYNILKLNKKYR